MIFSSPFHDLFLSHTLLLDQSNAPSVLFVFLWQWKERKKMRKKKKQKTDATSWGKVCTLRLNSEPPRHLSALLKSPPRLFLGHAADLLIWHAPWPRHLITGNAVTLMLQHLKERETDNGRETRQRGGMCGEIPQTDGECMIDEPCKAINFTLGAVLDRLELAPLHYSHKPYV